MDAEQNFYEILGVRPDASLQEIMDGYLRVKAAFSRDSAALYTMMSVEEGEKVLKEIELAYQVLTHPERRRNYDCRFSVDELKKKEIEPNEVRQGPQGLPLGVSEARSNVTRLQSPLSQETRTVERVATDVVVSTAPLTLVKPPIDPVVVDGACAEAIALETEWSGAFLRRIREGCRMSIEEISAMTKINKHYLLALEEENYDRLPALVYIRGFVIQIARVLKLPHEKVAAAYVCRYQRCRKSS